MIENQKRARNHEHCLRKLKFILLRRWNFRLEKVHRIVSYKSASTASKPRQFALRHELIARHQFFYLLEGIAACFESLFVPVLDNPNLASVTLQNHARIHTHEGKTA